MQTTFKRELKPKRTDFSFKSGVFDYAAIRKAAAENPFGIKPDPPVLVSAPCTYNCGAEYNPASRAWSPGCNGSCAAD